MTKTFTKRFLAILLAFMLILSFTTSVSAEEKPITVLLNGNQLEFDVNPVLENGRTLVPMRVIFEALGAEVQWDDATWTAIATKGDTKIEITIDSNKMLKNGKIVELDVPARLRDSRTLVPVRAVSEGMGANVDWDDALWQVIITTEGENEAINPGTANKVPEADSTVYNFTELSPADKEKLLSEAGDIRYYFEQYMLPAVFFNDAKYAVPLIKAKDHDLLESARRLWEDLLVSYIITLQTESDNQYDIGNMAELTEEAVYSVYTDMIKDMGLSSENLFDVSYDTTPSGTNCLLVTFKTVDDLLDCKYIAMVVEGDGLRCFTAETTFSESSDINYMFCEITLESRGSYDVIKNKSDFFKGIDTVISTHKTPGAAQSRPLNN